MVLRRIYELHPFTASQKPGFGRAMDLADRQLLVWANGDECIIGSYVESELF